MKKEFEVVTCECGEECPVEFSYKAEDGWSCAECQVSYLSELLGDDQDLPNGIDLKALGELLKYSDRYEISIQFWPKQIAVYISKDLVDLQSYGNDFESAVLRSIAYLRRINK